MAEPFAQSVPMDDELPCASPECTADDWRRIRDALLYMGRDLHQRSYVVDAQRRELLWAEMDACLLLAQQIEASLPAAEA